jgi:macrodomain Ter protein organizer (MatP/YcbG family)
VCWLRKKEVLGESVGVCEYELWTRLAVMKRKKATGFVGWVTYEIKEKKRKEQDNVYAEKIRRIRQHRRKQNSSIRTNENI